MINHKIAPPTLSEMLQPFAEASDSDFEKIDEKLKSPNSTNLRDAEYVELSVSIGVDEVQVRVFFSLLEYLYEQTEGMEQNLIEGALEKYFDDILDSSQTEFSERLANKTAQLLKHRDAFELSMKRMRLTRGFLPFVTSSASFVDLRFDFERDGNNSLTGSLNDPIVVAQLAIETESPDNTEKQVLLQLDKFAVEELIKTLREIQEKLNIVEKVKLVKDEDRS